MAIQQASFFCPVCQQQRLFTRQESVNHILHLLVTLFSCGLWAIVWFFVTVSHNPRFHCAQCGHSDAYKYLANPNLRAQEAHLGAGRAALRGEPSGSYFNSLSTWFSGFNSQGKIFVIGAAIVVGVLGLGILGALTAPNQRSNNQANTAVNKTNAASFSPTPTPAVALKDTPKTGTTTARQSCADIESELASVESDQARVEEMLDATEDFGPQAGSPKRAIYTNALKRKGELQLRHIALEKKLRACGKRK